VFICEIQFFTLFYASSSLVVFFSFFPKQNLFLPVSTTDPAFACLARGNQTLIQGLVFDVQSGVGVWCLVFGVWSVGFGVVASPAFDCL
jgi:hypothetical protein